MDWPPSWYRTLTELLGNLTLLMGIVAGLNAAYRWFRRVFLKPELKLTFDRVKTFDDRNVRIGKDDLPSRWVHLCASATGSEIVRNARAYLTNVWYMSKDGKRMKLKGFKSKLILFWANTRFRESIEIMPADEVRLDLFYYVLAEPLKLIFHTPQHGVGTTTELYTGNYIIEVRALADNAIPATKELQVVVDDGDDNDDIFEVRVGEVGEDIRSVDAEPEDVVTIHFDD